MILLFCILFHFSASENGTKVTEDNWYVGMKVIPGEDWITQGDKVSGVGEILWKAYGSLRSGFCSTEMKDPTLNKSKDVSPLWVIVRWSDGKSYCHRIGAGGKYDLKLFTSCKNSLFNKNT